MRFKEELKRLKPIEGLEIEIIGKWLWVGGKTLKHKATLNELGMFWSRNKKKWYLPTNRTKAKRRGRFSYEQLRCKFAVNRIKDEKEILPAVA